jgi:hypothetical protein
MYPVGNVDPVYTETTPFSVMAQLHRRLTEALIHSPLATRTQPPIESGRNAGTRAGIYLAVRELEHVCYEHGIDIQELGRLDVHLGRQETLVDRQPADDERQLKMLRVFDETYAQQRKEATS